MPMLDKLEKIDVKVIGLTLMLVTTFLIFVPIGLPVPISNMTRILYDRVNALKPGAYVLMELDYGVENWGELGELNAAIVQQLMWQKVKIVAVATFSATGAFNFERAVKEFVTVPSDYKYGVDYVNLGFVAGGETAMSSLASNLKKTISADFYGTPLSQLSIMDKVNDISVFDIVIGICRNNDQFDGYARQFVQKYHVEMYLCTAGMSGPQAMAYFPQTFKAILVSTRSGAEYELLIKKPGRAVTGLDVLSGITFIAIILIILGNIGFISTKYVARKKEGQQGVT